MTVIETARLRLRPHHDDDAARVLDIHSRLEVIRWLGNPPITPMESLDEALAYIAKQSTPDHPFTRRCAIEVRDDGLLAGRVNVTGLVRREQGFVGEYELGWYLHPDSGGHGYATEAARALLDDAFAAGLDEVWCDMYPDNHPSAAVAMRLGLDDLGVRPDPWYGNESRMFHLTQDQWLGR